MWEKAVLSVYNELSNSIKPKVVKKCQLRKDSLTPGSREAIERMREYASKGLLTESGEMDTDASVDDESDED